MGLPAVLVAFVAGAGVWAGTRQLGWPAGLAATLGIFASMLLVAALAAASYS